MTFRMTVRLVRNDKVQVGKNFERLEDNSLNWQKVSVAEAKRRVKAAIETVAKSKFDYEGNSQLNEKPDQISLASSYRANTKQARNALGQFASGVVLDVGYTAPHAGALEYGVPTQYTIEPKNAPRLSFLVNKPGNYAGAANKSGTKVRSVVGNRVTMENAAAVIRQPRKGYGFVEDGIKEYWRQETGEVIKDFSKIAIKSGFKPR